MPTADEADDALEIVSSEPGSFAWGVWAERHPALVRQVRDASPYGPAQHRALDALLAEIADGVIEPLAPDAHDHDRWRAWGRGHYGMSWFDAPFLWAESYFYRRLLGAVGYFAPGPWQGVDPFAPFKQAELAGTAVDDELAALETLTDSAPGEREHALLHASLWGNRADLGFRITSGGTQDDGAGRPLLSDDSDRLWSLLPEGAAATVHLVADNAGPELVPDLLLLDHLLHHGRAARAVLHVKPYPYYVSDATTTDVVDALRRLRRADGQAAATATRLWSALADGRLEVRAHAFFCAPLPYDAMPDDLRREFADGTVTLLKGDLNYRRLVGDRHWPATTPFADRTAFFPGPVAALRTLKSDVVVGLDARTLGTLEDSGRPWRTSGTHAVIQASSRTGSS
ncbi:damage-control phosphatase ARMT1 family protein [Streptomyces sp. UNOC14_S4]|uniref:damage-control phosphatase ARMT1 family protein n=1 Tax=Streptomyces sp. UNOC14_S4 TaxID=2872340 RepID=UPI001E56C599|nr:damage-control phosphatase ARMT1 family protein [Streptomyces sp. UNOC14_S4]MCC3771103.1 protein-glutamate O-methyltransferase family protein [Streptomyces sp. UNOC14_S4]